MDVVVGPTTGGVILAFEVARPLGVGHLRGGGARPGRHRTAGVPPRVHHRSGRAGVPRGRHPDHRWLVGGHDPGHRVDRGRPCPGLGVGRPVRRLPGGGLPGIRHTLHGAVAMDARRPDLRGRSGHLPGLFHGAPAHRSGLHRDEGELTSGTKPAGTAPQPPEPRLNRPSRASAARTASQPPDAMTASRAARVSSAPAIASNLAATLPDAVHHEQVRLGYQAVVDAPVGPTWSRPLASSTGWRPGFGLLQLVRLDVDEVDPVLVRRGHALDDVQGRPAHGGLAERRGREHDQQACRGRRPGRWTVDRSRDRASGRSRSSRSPPASSRPASPTRVPGRRWPVSEPKGRTSNMTSTHGSRRELGRHLEAPRTGAVERDGRVVQAPAVAQSRNEPGTVVTGVAGSRVERVEPRLCGHIRRSERLVLRVRRA